MKTFKMEKVIIALDYDPTAQKVAEIGFTLATAMKAQVVLMHVTYSGACPPSLELS